jgi:hypothetical protein
LSIGLLIGCSYDCSQFNGGRDDRSLLIADTEMDKIPIMLEEGGGSGTVLKPVKHAAASSSTPSFLRINPSRFRRSSIATGRVNCCFRAV